MFGNPEGGRARNPPNCFSVEAAGVRWWGIVGMAALVLIAPFDARATNCKPRRPLPAIVLTSMGPCKFDRGTFSFAGDPVEQAKCLLRPVLKWAKLGPNLSSLPPVLAARVGRASSLPDRSALAALLTELQLDRRFGEGLLHPISRARDNDPEAPTAKYFVIHDTSGPKLRTFPTDIDENRRINNLARFRCSDSFEVAHVIANRRGDLFVGHYLSVPWRSTKLERALNFGGELKGLFLHVELIQPRRGRHDTLAPNPGFSAIQYDRLALVYTLASVRAGQWLIPAFHAVIDYDIFNGHDDPQNFDLESFAHSLGMLLDQLSQDRAAPLKSMLSPLTPLQITPSP
ncbi:hypothetical protein [Bradyrhizobium sp. RT3b]|uniref:hypothetical protein n=1 Tax=Bradyrhizobium sp. RT3b TaxID=3156334 RepID=UPI0033922129